MSIERFKGSEFLVKEVRSRLLDIISIYDYATVADYYDLIGHESKYSDNKIGWLSLQKATIVMATEPNMYELVLPKPIPVGE